MKVCNVMIAAAVAAVLGAASSAMADVLVTPPVLSFSTGSFGAPYGGGEFTFSPTFPPGQLNADAYVNTVTSNYQLPSSFQTFCAEDGEFIYYNNQYSAVVSTTNTNGTNGSHTVYGSGSSLAANPTGQGVNLTPQAAYLYYKFATGTLTPYNYTSTGTTLDGATNRVQSAGLLQVALWHFMGYDNFPTVAATDYYINNINAMMTADHWSGIQTIVGNAQSGYTTYKVHILNLYQDGLSIGTGLVQDPHTGMITPTDRSYLRQDQFWLEKVSGAQGVPVPSVACMSLALLGSFGVFSRIRRRKIEG